MGLRRRKVGFVVGVAALSALGLTATIAPAGAAASKPAAPAKPTASPLSLKARVTWKAPANHGKPINSYSVTAFIGTAAKVTHAYNSTKVTQIFTGLKNATTYTFKVKAHNALGFGPFSVASAPVRVGAPVAPAAPKATFGNATVRVNWTAPANNGAGVIGYVVTPFVGATAKPAHTFNSTALAQDITGLTNGTSYTFKVAAKNSRGTGPASPASAASKPTTTPALRAVMNSTIGAPILVDSNGMTVYLFVPDGTNTTSSVNGGLRVAWPYVLWGGTTSVGSGLTQSLAVTHVQPDNTNLLSYNGHLLYLFISDHAPGDATGQGVANFFVLDASGNKIP